MRVHFAARPVCVKFGSKGKVSIAIIDITNETDKHYSVTINGKYLDKNGNVLKTETQEWDQFKAGWQKYLLFRPGYLFELRIGCCELIADIKQ